MLFVDDEYHIERTLGMDLLTDHIAKKNNGDSASLNETISFNEICNHSI